MRLLLAILMGCIGGFMLGIVLSELIGVFGMVLFNKPIGIKYLPFYTAILCAVMASIISQKNKYNNKG
ncbi:DUF5957 family protein [Sporosarcina sp. E16_8]|uniref:DUF5957 family protein n=1 Tax=Sporosarcina sp. E16_8 TaxID=2789295 RepID=UPI001A914914|nr:DUF5957 family protein [Sporosarcina sp. E16_8]MBO0588008.1 hypothetical protein [Sporosarcina sp. E16_8]